MILRPLACCTVVLLAILPAGARTTLQEKVAKYKADYLAQTKPVGRAKSLSKLGRAEFAMARRDTDAGNVDGALQLVSDYDEQAQETHEALVKTGVNAEKHSNGFRQLQISVRESLRQVREILNRIPYGQGSGFERLRANLDTLNQKLLLELFPRRYKGGPAK